MSIDFNGGQRGSVGSNSLAQNRAGFTVFAIVRPETDPSSGTERRIAQLTINGSSTSSRVTLTHRNDGAGAFLRTFSRRLDGDGGETVDSSAGSLAASGIPTYSVAIVCDWLGSSLRNFIDGTLQASASPGSWGGNSSNTTSDALSIGARADGSEFFDGQIENMMMWATALPDEAISALHATKGGLSNARALNDLAWFWPMRGQVGGAAGTFVEIWGNPAVNATGLGSPGFALTLGKEPQAFQISAG